MSVNLDYLQQNPPLHIKDIILTAKAWIQSFVNKSSDEFSTAFSASCVNGNYKFTIETTDTGYITINCPDCGDTYVILNSTEHGLHKKNDYKHGSLHVYACNNCNKYTFEIGICAHYPKDLDIETKNHPENHFKSLSVVAKCTHCDTVQEIYHTSERPHI